MHALTSRPPQGHVVARRDRGLPLALLLATPAIGHAEESNPTTTTCLGSIAAGQARSGQRRTAGAVHLLLQRPDHRLPAAGADPADGRPEPAARDRDASAGAPTGKPLTDTFSCSGEVPGYAVNCVGSTKAGYETITGQFAIGTKLCAEPRVDPLLTVTYAYLEKGVVTQAISGPFDLGRPNGCPPDAFSGGTRLNPKPVTLQPAKARKTGKKDGKKGKKGRQEVAASPLRAASQGGAALDPHGPNLWGVASPGRRLLACGLR